MEVVKINLEDTKACCDKLRENIAELDKIYQEINANYQRAISISNSRN